MSNKKTKKLPFILSILSVLSFALPWFDGPGRPIHGIELIFGGSLLQILLLIVFILSILQSYLSYKGNKQSFYMSIINLAAFAIFFIALYTGSGPLANVIMFGVYVTFLFILLSFLLNIKISKK